MIERHLPDVKVVGVDGGGVGIKHRTCFFHGNQITKYFVVHIVVIYNSGTQLIFFSDIEALRLAHTIRLFAGT